VERVDDGRGGSQLVFDPPPGADVHSTTIVYLHGGGWRRGSPEQYACVGHSLARQGWRTVIPSLRRSPGSRHPELLDDAVGGIRTARESARSESPRIVVIGHSSGAQLGVFAAMDRSAGERLGVPAGSVDGLITIGGPLDLSLCTAGYIGRLVGDFAGPPDSESRRAADPIAVAERGMRIPVLCLHGGRDPVVPVGCSRSFVDTVNTVHPGTASLAIGDNLHHVDTLRLFLQREHPVGKLMKDWIAGIDTAR
jgi:acetyl esterase/lipase